MIALLLALAPVPQGGIETRTLECGLELTVLRAPDASSIRGTLLAAAGPDRERADQVGIGRVLVDAIAAGGCGERDRAAIDAWLDEVGADIDLARSRRCVALDLGGPPAALEGLLVLARELFEHPALAQGALEAGRAGLLDELALRGRDPAALADRTAWELAFGERVQRARLPHPSDVAALDRADLIDFLRGHFGASDLHLVLTGPLEPDTAALVERVFAGYPPSAGPPGQRAPAARALRSPADGIRIVVLDLPQADHAELRVALPSVPRGHPDAPALELFGRYHEVVQPPGEPPVGERAVGPQELHDAARVDFTFDELLLASLSVRPEDAAVGLRALLTLLRPSEHEALREEQLRLARAALLDGYEDPDPLSRARSHALLWMAAGDVEAALAHVEGLPAAGPDEIRAALERRAQAGGVLVVAAGRADLLVPELEAFGRVELRTGLRQPRGTEAGLDLRDRLLHALGGGAAWAELTALDAAGEARVPGLDQPVAVTVRRDLAAGALRIEQLGLATVSTPEGSWSRSASAFNELPAAAHERLRFAEERQLIRLARALARGRSVRVAESQGGALECWREGRLLAWLELGEGGHPTVLGYEDLEGQPTRVELSDWVELDGLVLPGRTRLPTRGSEHVWSHYDAAPDHDPGLFVRPPR